jgi:hypothetical protein
MKSKKVLPFAQPRRAAVRPHKQPFWLPHDFRNQTPDERRKSLAIIALDESTPDSVVLALLNKWETIKAEREGGQKR